MTTEKLTEIGEELRRFYHDVIPPVSLLSKTIHDFSADDLNHYHLALVDAYSLIQTGLDFAAMEKKANAGFPEAAWGFNQQSVHQEPRVQDRTVGGATRSDSPIDHETALASVAEEMRALFKINPNVSHQQNVNSVGVERAQRKSYLKPSQLSKRSDPSDLYQSITSVSKSGISKHEIKPGSQWAEDNGGSVIPTQVLTQEAVNTAESEAEVVLQDSMPSHANRKHDLQYEGEEKAKIGGGEEIASNRTLYTEHNKIEISQSESRVSPPKNNTTTGSIKGLGDLAAKLNSDKASGHHTRNRESVGKTPDQNAELGKQKNDGHIDTSLSRLAADIERYDAGKNIAGSRSNSEEKREPLASMQDLQSWSNAVADRLPLSTNDNNPMVDDSHPDLSALPVDDAPFSISNQPVVNNASDRLEDVSGKKTKAHYSDFPDYGVSQQYSAQLDKDELPSKKHRSQLSEYSSLHISNSGFQQEPEPVGPSKELSSSRIESVSEVSQSVQASIDTDSILEELTKKIRRDYKRFYRS